MVKVEQVEWTPADIEAANAFFRECPLSVNMVLGRTPSIVRNAFARHRTEAQAELVECLREVVELRQLHSEGKAHPEGISGELAVWAKARALLAKMGEGE